MAMTAGQLRHRITLQKPQKPLDGRGGRQVQWVDVATIWAAVVPLKPSEQLQARQVQSSVTHTVTVRYRTDPTASMRFRWDGRLLYIQGPPVDPDGRRTWLEAHCEERRE